MKTNVLKENIHRYIDCINDVEYLKGLHALVIDKAANSDFSLTLEQINIVEEREAEYRRGEAVTYTLEEAKKELRKRAASK